MSVRITLLPCLAAALFIGACDKDKATEPAASKASLLTHAAGWKITADRIDPAAPEGENGALITDLFAAGGCSHDDLTKFTGAGKFSVDEGASKCDPSDPQTETGSWSLDASEDTLTMVSDIDHVTTKFKVESLTAGTLKVSTSDDGWEDGVMRVETLTFTAQ